MLHRHLTHQQFTLAAIDDIIARGKRQDWAELRKAALADRTILENVSSDLSAPSANRHLGRSRQSTKVRRYLHRL